MPNTKKNGKLFVLGVLLSYRIDRGSLFGLCTVSYLHLAFVLFFCVLSARFSIPNEPLYNCSDISLGAAEDLISLKLSLVQRFFTMSEKSIFSSFTFTATPPTTAVVTECLSKCLSLVVHSTVDL